MLPGKGARWGGRPACPSDFNSTFTGTARRLVTRQRLPTQKVMAATHHALHHRCR